MIELALGGLGRDVTRVHHVGILKDGHDAEIGVRGKAAIQRDLPFAGVASLFECGEIEETEIHGLLHFQDEGRREDDHGDTAADDHRDTSAVAIRLRRAWAAQSKTRSVG